MQTLFLKGFDSLEYTSLFLWKQWADDCRKFQKKPSLWKQWQDSLAPYKLQDNEGIVDG